MTSLYLNRILRGLETVRMNRITHVGPIRIGSKADSIFLLLNGMVEETDSVV